MKNDTLFFRQQTSFSRQEVAAFAQNTSWPLQETFFSLQGVSGSLQEVAAFGQNTS